MFLHVFVDFLALAYYQDSMLSSLIPCIMKICLLGEGVIFLKLFFSSLQLVVYFALNFVLYYSEI